LERPRRAGCAADRVGGFMAAQDGLAPRRALVDARGAGFQERPGIEARLGTRASRSGVAPRHGCHLFRPVFQRCSPAINSEVTRTSALPCERGPRSRIRPQPDPGRTLPSRRPHRRSPTKGPRDVRHSPCRGAQRPPPAHSTRRAPFQHSSRRRVLRAREEIESAGSQIHVATLRVARACDFFTRSRDDL